MRIAMIGTGYVGLFRAKSQAGFVCCGGFRPIADIQPIRQSPLGIA